MLGVWKNDEIWKNGGWKMANLPIFDFGGEYHGPGWDTQNIKTILR